MHECLWITKNRYINVLMTYFRTVYNKSRRIRLQKNNTDLAETEKLPFNKKKIKNKKFGIGTGS